MKKAFAIIRLTTKEVMQLNMVQDLAARTLLVILAAAVIQDFLYMKISNRLILMGILFSLAFGYETGGIKQVLYVLANLSFPVIMLYLLYLLGVLGAGDIKLFSIIGGFTNFRVLTGCMLYSLFVGAIIATCKMLYNRNLRISLFKAGVYFRTIRQEGIVSYHQEWAESRNLMHFSVAILIGYLLTYF